MDEISFASLTDSELAIVIKLAFMRIEREATILGIDVTDPEWAKKEYPPDIKVMIPHLTLEEVCCLIEKTKRDIQRLSDELKPPIDLVPDDES